MTRLSTQKKGSNDVLKTIDFSILLTSCNHDIVLSKSLLKQFIDDIATQKPAIEAAYQTLDFNALHHHIHRLSGSASICGLAYIKQVTPDIINVLYKKDTDSLNRYMPLLFDAIDETIKAYEQGDFLE